MGRGFVDLLKVVTNLIDELGVGFLSLKEQIQTNSAYSKLIFDVFSALAEFERNLISERIKAAFDTAMVLGRKGG